MVVPVLSMAETDVQSMRMACHASDLFQRLGECADFGFRCGPRKLAKVLNLCLDRTEQSRKDRAAKNGDANSPHEHKPSESEPATKRDQHGEVEDGEDLEKFNGPPSVSALNPEPEKVSRSSSGPSQGGKSDESESGRDKGEDSGQQEEPEPRDQNEYKYPESDAPQAPFTKPLVLARSPTDAPTAKRSASDNTNLHGLCVDDNKINLRLLVTLMRKERHTYEQAENGQEALEVFKASTGVESIEDEDDSPTPFDFICMDIGMPVMNGIQCTKAIREFERQHDLQPTYIVACTAWGDEQTQREAEAAGMDAFLPKPLKFVHLKDILARLLKKE
jgi:CheY-like chemotaxis protein